MIKKLHNYNILSYILYLETKLEELEKLSQ